MAKRTDWFLSALVTLGAAVACHSSNNATSTSNDASTTGDGGDYNPRVNLDAGPATAESPDGGSLCLGSCNYQTQSGCDTGSMCSPQMNTDQTAVSAGCQTAGTIAAGEACTWAECQPGYICSSDGHCRHMCCGGDWSVCAAKESCTGAVALQPAGGSTPVPAGVGVCEPTDDCDVLDPESCPSGQSCYIIDSRGGVKCLSTGSRDINENCSATELCRSGLSCFVTPNGTNQCRRLCRAVQGGGLPGCPLVEGTFCSHSANEPLGVGECLPAGST
jgi:hypothetical protein